MGDGNCDCGAPRCSHTHSDDERAAELQRYLEDICETDGVEWDELRLFRTEPGSKDLRVFKLGKGIFENPKRRFYEYTAGEAIQATRNGASGFGLYLGRGDCGTKNIGVIDNDDVDLWPYGDTPADYAVLSGSGEGYHHPFVHDGSVKNANSKKETPYEGSVRTETYYHLLPGSVHPSGGIYSIDERDDIPSATQDDFPEDLKPRKETVSGPDGEKLEIPRDPPEELEDAEYRNELGWSLETVRDKSEELDKLLSRLAPPGYSGDRSTADAAAVNRLWYWGFSRKDIAHILRQYRRYEKTERDDYLYEHTIPFATGGERILQYYDDEGNWDPDPMAILPLDRLDALDHEQRVRYAKQRGIDWPDVDEVRGRLHDELTEAVAENKTVVKSAPTGAGKTHAVATEPWLVSDANGDRQPTIHAHRTREARDQAASMSEDAGVEHYVLKGRKELCPVAAGEHDPEKVVEDDGTVRWEGGVTIEGEPISDWMDHRCDSQGIPFSVVHRWAETEADGDLPCEHGNEECAAKGQFDGVPRNGEGEPEYDVIHCTHQFLHVPSMRMHTNVFIDEKPAFGIDLEPERIRQAINAYLDWADAPVDNYSALVFAAQHSCEPEVADQRVVNGAMLGEYKSAFGDRMDEALSGTPEFTECPTCDGEGELDFEDNEYQQISDYEEHGGAGTSNTCPECEGDGEVFLRGGEPGLSWFRDNPKAHALAPAFARAVWSAEEGPAGRKHATIPYRPPRLDDSHHDEAGWNREFVDIVLNDQWEIVDAQAVPDFSLASSVVGLDAHPQPKDPAWRANCHPDIQTDYTLDSVERTLYRRYERGLFTVQVGEGVQPVTSGKWLSEGQGKKFEAVVEQLADQYDTDFDSAITSMEARPFVREAMEDSGVDEPEMMHFGNEESRNDFAGKGVGLVVGSIDPGDEMVVNMLARLGLDAEPCYEECPSCEGERVVETDDGEYERCETCNGKGRVREHGRTFEGEDAEAADAALKGVREHHVAQSAGRWARDADDPDDNATVFVITEAAPEGFIDAKAPGVTWVTSDDQRERLEYVRDNADGVTAKGVAEECGCSKQAAWRTLRKAAEKGLLEKTPGAGPYGADVYSPDETFSTAGSADVQPADGATATGGVQETNTYTVTIDALPHCAFNTTRDGGREWQHQSTFEWYTDPPSPPT